MTHWQEEYHVLSTAHDEIARADKWIRTHKGPLHLLNLYNAVFDAKEALFERNWRPNTQLIDLHTDRYNLGLDDQGICRDNVHRIRVLLNRWTNHLQARPPILREIDKLRAEFERLSQEIER